MTDLCREERRAIPIHAWLTNYLALVLISRNKNVCSTNHTPVFIKKAFMYFLQIRFLPYIPKQKLCLKEKEGKKQTTLANREFTSNFSYQLLSNGTCVCRCVRWQLSDSVGIFLSLLKWSDYVFISLLFVASHAIEWTLQIVNCSKRGYSS